MCLLVKLTKYVQRKQKHVHLKQILQRDVKDDLITETIYYKFMNWKTKLVYSVKTTIIKISADFFFF